MAMPIPEPRAKTRHHMAPDVRLTLAEGDLDRLEAAASKREAAALVREAKLDSKIDKIVWVLVAGVISTATAAVLLAVNIAVTKTI